MGRSSSSSTSFTDASTETRTATTNNVDNRIGGGGGAIGGNININAADTTQLSGLTFNSIDAGAVDAGLKVALAGLDTARSENAVNAQTTQDAIGRAAGLAEIAAQGHSDESQKYILYAVVALGAAALFFFSRGK